MEIIRYTADDLRIALDVMENALDVGEKVRVSLHSEILATDEQCGQLYLDMVALGEHASYPVISVVDGIPTLEFELTKGSPALPLAVIPLIALFGILGIITFGVIKLESITKALLPLTLVVVSGVIIIAGLMRRPAERIAERVSMKYLPSTIPKAEDALAVSSPFLIEETIEFKGARSYVKSIRDPYIRDYANRYLWHLLGFAKKPSDRGLPEPEVRDIERKITEFIPQYSTTVNPFKKEEMKPKAKYVLIKGGVYMGTIVSVESWEREKAGMIARGETVPEVEHVEEKPEKYEPATVEGEPIPEKYRELIPFFDSPLPPGADFLPAVVPEVGERKIDVVLRQLKDGVEGIQDSAQFRLFLTTMAKFHDYSVSNLILISLQKPEATRVAGFVTWKDLGRWVKKGARGIAILAPIMPPKPKKEEEEEEIVPLAPVYFRVVHVFDISQTEGEPLPEFEVPVLTGEANEELFSKVMTMAKAQGLEVSFESRPHQDPSIKGQYSSPKSIWVRPEESRAQQLKSLLHEVAHYYSEGVFRIPRRDAETIAESAAFAIGAHYGFDSGVRSFPYVALWAQDKKVLAQNLSTIRKVADTILDSLSQTHTQSTIRYLGETAFEYLPDTPEYLTETIETTGYWEKLDSAFQEALARSKS